MKVGDKVPSQTMMSYFPPRTLTAVPGICVYIHPKRRYYTLKFELSSGIIHESYKFQYGKGEGA